MSRRGLLFFAIVFGWVGTAMAQEFTPLFWGLSASHGVRFDSYSWMLDYRQGISGNVESSLSWINEGHFMAGTINHHRDGLALEGWYDLPVSAFNAALSVGAGVDYFFDSQEVPLTGPAGPGSESLDMHRFAPLVSADLKWYWSKNLFLRLRATEILPFNQTKNPSHFFVDFGAGRYFGPPRAEHVRHLPSLSESLGDEFRPDSAGADRWAATVYWGLSRVNTFFRTGGRSVAGEIRYHYFTHFDLSATYLYEGNAATVRRQGLAFQGWIMSTEMPEQSSYRVGIGLGIGPYLNIDTKRKPTSGQSRRVPFIAGLVSPTMALELPRHCFLRLTWNRVVTNYDEDADVWLVGAGYRFE